MDRQRAFERVQLWLGLSEFVKMRPSMAGAHKLANVVYNITDGKEVYTTGFVFDVWCELRSEEVTK